MPNYVLLQVTNSVTVFHQYCSASLACCFFGCSYENIKKENIARLNLLMFSLLLDSLFAFSKLDKELIVSLSCHKNRVEIKSDKLNCRIEIT